MKRFTFVCITFIGFLLGLPHVAVASEEETVTLASLIEEAKKNNQGIEAARLRWEAAKEEIIQTRFLEDPQVSVTQWGVPENLNIGKSDETWLGVEQSIPYPGKRSLKGQIATKDWETTEKEYQAKVLIVVSEIKSAYYQLFLLYKSIDLHKEHQTLLGEFIEIAEKKYTVGQGMGGQDILKAQVEQSKLHNSLIELTNSIAPLKAKINTLINRPVEMPLQRPEELTPRPFPFSQNVLTQKALANQPALQGASLMIEKGTLAKNLAKKEYRPDFMVELNYWNVHGDANEWMAMGKMTLPWVYGQKYDSKYRKAFLDEGEAKADFSAMKNETLSEITTQLARIKTAEQVLSNYQSSVIPLATQLLRGARIGYQAGRVDFLHLIDSERTLLDLQMEYYMKLTEFWQGVALLEPMIGKEIDL